MTKSKYIKIILISCGAMASVGFLIQGLIYLFAMLIQDLQVGFKQIKTLTESNDILFITHLIPFSFVFMGLLIARKIKLYIEKNEATLAAKNIAIQNTIDYARKIERGSYEDIFQCSEDLDLTKAIEDMRNSLYLEHQKEEQRNSVNEMISELVNIIRSIENIEDLGFEIVKFMVDEIDYAVQGAFYVVNNNGEADTIDLVSSYAYKRKKRLQSSYRFAEGLIGQAAIEQGIIHRTEIPENYMTVSSGLLGDKKPSSIIILPLIAQDKTIAVIEIASTKKFTKTQLHFFHKVGDSIARTIHNIQVTRRTQCLLDESEKMASELSEQKQQLINNADQMIETQEELQKSNVQLEEQMQQTRISNKRTNVFLENSIEVIFVIGKDGTNLFVSPAIKNVLGYYPDEVIGYKTSDNLHPLDIEQLDKMLNNIKSFPEKKHLLQFRYFTKSGQITWLEAIGNNALNDESIKGYVLNMRDISEQRLAAKEQRMRAKMQALSENSPDLIVRIDIFGRCTYINPVIKDFTGLDMETFLDKPINNVNMDESVLHYWKQTVDKVVQEKDKYNSEMIFPTQDGEKIMAVSAIPEYADNGDVESALIVCHDITEAKNREVLIRKKNVSISDSINYAFSIQSALMPTEKLLQSKIPNSFMMYKPKDVVSGDYPYMFENGDNIFIGAMDCTGHGVPGALMSIIGFFLQNQAMQLNANIDAGEMLDNLHSNIVTTLRQDEDDSRLNDGMDAAMVKVNTKTMELHFAGAHRPLYHVRDGKLNVIKGNKFPVGSTQYSNRKPFINHSIKIEAGDSFYFMTDGFPDQLGGPTGKQKYMSGRVNILIQENTHLSIFQMGNLFKRTFSEWKGDTKQVDDILVIGLKF